MFLKWKKPGDINMEKFGKHINLRDVFVSLFYTIIICAVIAVFLTIRGPRYFINNLIMSLSFGLSICSIILLLLKLFKPEKTVSILFIFIMGVAGGTSIGLLIGSSILQRFFSISVSADLLRTIVSAIIMGGAVGWFFYSKARLRISNRIIQEERISRLSSEKETLEAKLRLLQAQIEPHFLFNTLSNVLSLIDTEPAKGKSMLTDLIHYLRTSLSRTLPEITTLGQEIDMIKAYLSIQKIRMDERLNFTIELPDTLRQHSFPPMLLQPLVENAIKHGLEPKIDGGSITIKVIEKDNLIRIEVIDTGIGLSTYQKNGVGIGNVKERLQLLYGEKGRLTLEENKPNGVRATIEVPKHDV
jgi:sensor histidine kinase YesM